MAIIALSRGVTRTRACCSNSALQSLSSTYFPFHEGELTRGVKCLYVMQVELVEGWTSGR